jgi:beta-phosphoglucomutase-like phosphatase (HAD superfamily)
MKPRAIFFDDGGVLSDNTRRGADWERLIGEFLAPRLGGAPEAWGEVNRAVFWRQWQRFESWIATRSDDDGWVDFFAAPEERERWLREMCEQVGITSPGFDECVALAEEATVYVLPRVRCAYPDTPTAIRTLARAGCALSTASGSVSLVLEFSLGNMDVRQYFSEHLYGGDLVAQVKDRPRFYERVFAHAGVEPADALVLDDTPSAIAWATQAGARAVLVARGQIEVPDRVTAIDTLAGLPAFLESLD